MSNLSRGCQIHSGFYKETKMYSLMFSLSSSKSKRRLWNFL